MPPCRQVPGRDAQAVGADAERQLRAAGELEQRGLGHAELGRERALATFETMFRGLKWRGGAPSPIEGARRKDPEFQAVSVHSGCMSMRKGVLR